MLLAVLCVRVLMPKGRCCTPHAGRLVVGGKNAIVARSLWSRPSSGSPDVWRASCFSPAAGSGRGCQSAMLRTCSARRVFSFECVLLLKLLFMSKACEPPGAPGVSRSRLQPAVPSDCSSPPHSGTGRDTDCVVVAVSYGISHARLRFPRERAQPSACPNRHRLRSRQGSRIRIT